MEKKLFKKLINIAYELLDDDYYLLTERLKEDKEFLNALKEFSVKELVEVFEDEIFSLYIKNNKEAVIKNKEEWYKELENRDDIYAWMDEDEMTKLGLNLDDTILLYDYLKLISGDITAKEINEKNRKRR